MLGEYWCSLSLTLSWNIFHHNSHWMHKFLFDWKRITERPHICGKKWSLMTLTRVHRLSFWSTNHLLIIFHAGLMCLHWLPELYMALLYIMTLPILFQHVICDHYSYSSRLRTFAPPWISSRVASQSKTFPLGTLFPEDMRWMVLSGRTESHILTSLISPTKLCLASKEPL